ncbi:hypothetical protein AAZX31_05G210100 [Glycine max]
MVHHLSLAGKYGDASGQKENMNQMSQSFLSQLKDLGKIILLPKFGDTFPVGCAFDKANIHHKDNPDSEYPANNTKKGIYAEGCGLENVTMSWEHDEYMYMVAKENSTTLPSTGLFIIRFHSIYFPGKVRW